MLTSCHHPAEEQIQQKKYKNGNCNYKLVTVKEYNSHMGGVDHIDQQLHSFIYCEKVAEMV